MAERVLALIMAGGAGSRLEPLTNHRSKPAVPYAGVYRLIDFPLSNCAHSRINDVWVLQQFQPYSLNRHLAGGRPWDLDRTNGGLQLLFPHQGDGEGGWHQGNADAIYHNRSLLRDFDPDVLVVLSADHVYKLDYRTVVARHLERGADLTMVTTSVPTAEVTRFGNVGVDDDERVQRFTYKPEVPVSDLAVTEVFVFHAARLLDTLDELAGDHDEGLEDLGDGLLPRLVDRGRVWEHRFDGYWRDVGLPESYWRSHMDLLEPEPLLRLDDPDWPILTNASTRPPARVEATASIESSLLSPGCVVQGKVVRSVLGPGVIVERGAEVRDSVVLDNAVVEAGGVLAGAICDMGARIGAGASVGLSTRPGKVPGPDELVVVGEGVAVPSGARVDAGSRLAEASPAD